MKRLFDLIFSIFGLVLLSPLFLMISLLIIITSRGGSFYQQVRVGFKNKDFKILKFRTMEKYSEELGLLTIGNNDSRITKIGYYLRKYKIDELPQLINVLFGDMTFVGPRPEVRKFVNLYSVHQMKVLNVKPGITDLASIKFIDEDEILSSKKNPESFYIDYILPEKILINLNYIQDRNLIKDIIVIWKTIKSVVLRNK